jgi:multidrug efflux pump
MRRSLGTAVFSGMLGVTIFGIFLTPVFFYVIQGLGESRLFASAASRWIASCLAAGLTGGTGGYLLGVLHVVRLPWGPIVGASGGVFIMLGLLEFRRRIAPKMPAFSRNGSSARNGEAAAPARNGDQAPAGKSEGSLGGKQL